MTVSYVWGPDTNSHEISIHGQAFYVRDNLLTLLRGLCGSQRRDAKLTACLEEWEWQKGWARKCKRLDRSLTKVYYWIDPICIDQKNVEERNAQVQMMADIFSQGREMRAFITDVDENKFKALRSAASRAQASGFWEAQNWWLQATQANGEKDSIDHADPFKLLGYLGLEALVASKYWARTWIFQEFVLPRRVFLQCGKSIWEAHMLVEWLGNPHRQKRRKLAVQPIQRQRSILTKNAISILCKHRWIKTRRRRSWDRFETTIYNLGDLLVECQGHDCSERKDKVYALLGLSYSAYQRELVVDYDLSLLKTFHGVLQCINKLETKGLINMRTAAVLYKELLVPNYAAYKSNSNRDICAELKGGFVAEAYFRGLVVEHRALLPDDEFSSLDLRWDTAINATMLLHSRLAMNEDGLLFPQKSSLEIGRGRSLCSLRLGHFHVVSQAHVEPGDQIWQFLNTEKALLVRKMARDYYMILGGALFLKHKYSSFKENDFVGLDFERRVIKLNTEQLLEYSSWLQTPSFDEEQAEDDQSEVDQIKGDRRKETDRREMLVEEKRKWDKACCGNISVVFSDDTDDLEYG